MAADRFCRRPHKAFDLVSAKVPTDAHQGYLCGHTITPIAAFGVRLIRDVVANGWRWTCLRSATDSALTPNAT